MNTMWMRSFDRVLIGVKAYILIRAQKSSLEFEWPCLSLIILLPWTDHDSYSTLFGTGSLYKQKEPKCHYSWYPQPYVAFTLNRVSCDAAIPGTRLKGVCVAWSSPFTKSEIVKVLFWDNFRYFMKFGAIKHLCYTVHCTNWPCCIRHSM